MYVWFYVDDIIIAANTSIEIQEVKTEMQNLFKRKELGKVKFFLKMEMDHDLHCSKLMIRQTRYIDDVVSRLNQQDAKAVDNPFESVMKLSKMQPSTAYDDNNGMKSKPNRSLLGCMLYITTCTRSNIAYVVTQM